MVRLFCVRYLPTDELSLFFITLNRDDGAINLFNSLYPLKSKPIHLIHSGNLLL